MNYFLKLQNIYALLFALLILNACANTSATSASLAPTTCTIYGWVPNSTTYRTFNCNLIVADKNTLALSGSGISLSRTSPPPQTLDITGQWLAYGYGCPDGSGGAEQVAIRQTGNSYVATKVTGDSCIPAGHVTFFGTIFTGQPQSPSNGAVSNDDLSPQQAMAACQSGTLTRKNVVEKIDCYDQAYIKSQPGFTHPALLYQFDAANKEAAAKYADGKISQVQFKAVVAQNFANLKQDSENALASDMQAAQNLQSQQQALQAQQDANRAAAWQGFSAFGANAMANSAGPGAVTLGTAVGQGLGGVQQQPAPTPSATKNMFCVPINGGVSCTPAP